MCVRPGPGPDAPARRAGVLLEGRQDEDGDMEVLGRWWEHRASSRGCSEGYVPVFRGHFSPRAIFLARRSIIDDKIKDRDVDVVRPLASNPATVDTRSHDVSVIGVNVGSPNAPSCCYFLTAWRFEVDMWDPDGEGAILTSLHLWQRLWGTIECPTPLVVVHNRRRIARFQDCRVCEMPEVLPWQMRDRVEHSIGFHNRLGFWHHDLRCGSWVRATVVVMMMVAVNMMMMGNNFRWW